LKPGTDSAAIDERFRGGPTPTGTRTKGVFQASSLADLIGLVDISRYLGCARLGLMAVLLPMKTIKTVENRIQEHAILQTLGLTVGSVFRLVMTECLLTSF